MTTTVIDQLIVRLGLDPSGFTRGQKQAAAGQVQLQQTVTKSTDAMGAGFVGLTKKLLGVATVAVTLKKVIGYTSELSTTLRQLGIDSANYGVAAAELRNFGNIAENMGGKAEDVTRTVGGLSKAVYDLAYNGQVSDSLIMLNRLGVQFQETTGEARDFKSIVLDSQNAVQSLMARGTSRENARHMLAQAGFDEGLIQAMLQGSVGTQLATQQARRQVTPGLTGAATRWEQSAANRSQSIDAAALRGFEGAASVGTFLNDQIAAGGELSSTVEPMKGAAKVYARSVEKTTDAMVWAAGVIDSASWDKRRPQGRQFYEGTIQGAAAKYGINPEMLAGLLQTESNFNPNAKNASGATGIAQLMPQYFPGAGNDPHADIYTAAAELSRLQKGHLADGNDEAAAWWLALQSYNAGDSRLRKSMAPGGKPLAQETVDYPGKVMEYASGARVSPGAGGAGNRVEITFEEVNVNTSSSDGTGVARDFVDVTGRKLKAAHADRGVQ